MKKHMTQHVLRIGLMLSWLIGAALIVLSSTARADHVPPGILVIHFNTPPDYMQRPAGQDQYTTGDIKDAMQLAMIGDAEAQSNLGVMLASRGNYKEAAYWEQKAANSGLDTAAYNLGTLYFNGQGFQQDYAKAHEYFAQAAARGNKYAEFQLGMTYFTGQGVEKAPAQEIYWYKKAARQGLPAAAYNLGVIYNNGDEVPQDYVQAYAWMLLAQKGGLDAKDALATIATNLSASQIQAAEKMSHNLAFEPQPDMRK